MVDVVVMAHGRQERLAAELGAMPKHCLSLGRESILERTLRLVRELGGERLSLCAPAGVATPPQITRPSTSSSATLIENMYASAFRPASGAQLFLLGDVVWSRDSLERVIADTRGGPRFYGRDGPNPFTGKRYGELFAVRVDPDELLPHLEATMLWALMAALRGRLVPIHDWTDDVDTPEDLTQRFPLLRELVQRTSIDPC